MNNSVYSIGNKTIEMPECCDVDAWKGYFKELAAKKSAAPKYVVYEYYSFMCDDDVHALCDTNEEVYYDTANELSEDTGPAFEAAVSTGFIEEGIRQLVKDAHKDSTNKNDIISVVCTIFKKGNCADFIAAEIVQKARKLFNDQLECYGDETPIEDLAEICVWSMRLEEAILADPNAPTSILGYFLEAATGKYCSIFCPLGYEAYEVMGREMFERPEFYEVAKIKGLFAGAIATYFGAALDVVENWAMHYPGTKFILEHPELRCMVPARDRYVAKKLISLGADGDVEDDVWYQWSDEIWNEIGDELRGY